MQKEIYNKIYKQYFNVELKENRVIRYSTY